MPVGTAVTLRRYFGLGAKLTGGAQRHRGPAAGGLAAWGCLHGHVAQTPLTATAHAHAVALALFSGAT